MQTGDSIQYGDSSYLQIRYKI